MSNGAKFISALILAIMLGASAGTAQETAGTDRTRTSAGQPIDHVLELFTSQGCVSCPPADRILTTLSGRPDVLALAYHVDYWDYIGWRDPLGSPENTERQRDYAKAFSTSTIYTPQMVVNGGADLVGSREQMIRALMKSAKLPPEGVRASISMRLVGDRLHISVSTKPAPTDRPMPILILVTFADQVTTTIESGENRGKTVVNTHPVRDWRVLGMWQGKPMDVDLPADMLKRQIKDGGKGGCAALLQSVHADGSPGPILAAARMDFGAGR